MGMVMIIITKVAMNTFTIGEYDDEHIHHLMGIAMTIFTITGGYGGG